MTTNPDLAPASGSTRPKVIVNNTVQQPVYGLGFIGALIYFLSQATGFWVGVLAVLKAIVWPAFVIYELLKFFQL